MLYVGWKASAFTGQTWSTSSIVWRWHLKAYFFSWAAGDGSKYSTAILPSTDAVAYPKCDEDKKKFEEAGTHLGRPPCTPTIWSCTSNCSPSLAQGRSSSVCHICKRAGSPWRQQVCFLRGRAGTPVRQCRARTVEPSLLGGPRTAGCGPTSQ